MRALTITALCSIALFSAPIHSATAQENVGQKDIDICDVLRDEIVSYKKTKVRKSVSLGGNSSSSEPGLNEIWNKSLYSRVIPLIGMYTDLGCSANDLKDGINKALAVEN